MMKGKNNGKKTNTSDTKRYNENDTHDSSDSSIKSNLLDKQAATSANRKNKEMVTNSRNDFNLTSDQMLRYDIFKFIMPHTKSIITSFSDTEKILDWLKKPI